MKRTKIVCTIGPASESVDTLCALLRAGMNVARLNFSHGSHEEHAQRIQNIRLASRQCDLPVAIMLDTKGPEIRTGNFKDGRVTLQAGQKVTLTTELIEGDAKRFAVNYSQLAQEVHPGDTILLDDGLIALTVESAEGTEIYCQVQNTGEVSNHKGVNIPNVAIGLPAVTEKDYADILFGIEQGVDFIAASFIRSAGDVLEIRKILEEHQANIHIISKIENQQGVDHLEEILALSDGLMVARGDLGVEIPAEQVPLVQKQMIAKCNLAGKPVITATQMLDSMMRNPRPTRAEASDVANAIFDGTDAIMLSGETAAGKYPLESVQTMANIAAMTETALDYAHLLSEKGLQAGHSTTAAIGYATCTTARNLEAAAIITATESGSTARMVSKFRPETPIIAITHNEETQRKLLLNWGIVPLLGVKANNTDELIDQSIQIALQHGYIQRGDLVVLTAGVPVGIPGTTNLLKVEVVSTILAKGVGIGQESVAGPVKLVREAQDLSDLQAGDILVAVSTDASMIEAIGRSGAIITEEAGLTSHAAIVGMNLGKPVFVGAAGIMEQLKDGDWVTIDFRRGVVYSGQAQVK